MPVAPMFPLGAVVVPGMPTSLHVFEPRYRALTEHCLTEKVPFGVALIERGWEVGGGDDRFDTACLVNIVEHHRFTDGRYAVIGVGTERVKVTDWLAEDPYPQAQVEPWPDIEEAPADATLIESVQASTRRLFALATEAGLDAPPATVELSGDTAELGWQITAGGPFQPMDRLRLLEAEGATSRLRLAAEMLDSATEMLSMLMTQGAESFDDDL